MCYRCIFFNDTATTEIYTLSLHDALPIYSAEGTLSHVGADALVLDDGPHQMLIPYRAVLRYAGLGRFSAAEPSTVDRKSTRLNSSHANITYAVFCLKKKMQPHKP